MTCATPYLGNPSSSTGNADINGLKFDSKLLDTLIYAEIPLMMVACLNANLTFDVSSHKAVKSAT